MSDFDPASYWEARLNEHSDLAGVGFLPYGEKYNRWIYKAREDALDRALPPLRGVSVLDMGAGTGHFSAWCEARGATVSGIDLTEVAVARLRTRFPNRDFRRASVADPLPTEWQSAFDVVLLMDVLYHVTSDVDFEQAIANAATALKVGGLVALTLLPQAPPSSTVHVRARSAAEHRRALNANGVEVESEQAIASRLNAPPRAAGLVRRAGLGSVVGAWRYFLDRRVGGEPTLCLLTGRRVSA